MSVLSSQEYANIIRTQWMTTICPLIDPSQEAVIVDCKERLNKLAGNPIRCGALFFDKVLFRSKTNNSEPLLTSLCIGNNPKYTNASTQKVFGLSEDRAISLTQKEVDFYLYYGNKIYHIQMSSECNSLYALPSPKQEDPLWDTSAAKLNTMIQDWPNSFVTAWYSRDYIIPLPTTKPG